MFRKTETISEGFCASAPRPYESREMSIISESYQTVQTFVFCVLLCALVFIVSARL
jgi:hypothetical protein